MRTKLEAIAAYLAGRASDDDAEIGRELDDPASEVSRFLASTRSRSKAILDEPAPPPEPAARPRPAWAWVAIALLGLSGVAGLGWLVEARFRRLEANLARGRAEAVESNRLVVAAIEANRPVPTPPPVIPPFKEIEARLDRLIDRPVPAAEPARSEPGLAEFRAELEAIRREVLASERATSRQVQELRSLIQELGQSIRRAQAVTPAQLQALVNALSSPMAQSRLDAVEQLGRLGPNARSALPAIRQLIAREADAGVRAAAEAAAERLRAD